MENEEIVFFNASEYEVKLKCTIQRTGKLGFTDTTIKKLELNETKGVKLGVSNENDIQQLFLAIVDKPDESTFKISKAGAYYYVNAKAVFDKLKFDYKKKTIMFDMIEIEQSGVKLFKLIMREGKKKE